MDNGSDGRGATAERAWVVLGFGLFLVSYGGGPFGFVSGPAQHAVAWESLLFAQTAFFLAVVLGCMAVRFLKRRGLGRPWGIMGVAGYVLAVFAGLLLQPVLDGMSGQDAAIARVLLSLVSGVFYAPPFVFWAGRFCDLGRVSSHCGLAGVLILCYLLCPLVVTSCSLLTGLPYIYSIAQLVCAFVSALVQVRCSRSARDVCADAPEPRPYRLTPYSSSLLMGLGFSWGVSDVASLYGLADVPASRMALVVTAAFVSLLVVGVAVWMGRGRRDMRFGAIVRLAVVLCGAALAGMPLVSMELPLLLYPLYNLVMIAGEMALMIFTVDICNGEGRAASSVFTLNFALFMGTACASSLFFYAMHVLVGGHMAWMITGVVAVWAILAVIPFLPSRSSDAVVLMAETLPENEGYEANVAMKRSLMAQRYSLSEGEAVVLELLMQGKKRERIADELNLSPWTVKARTSSIYKKCGVHSYKELIQLISSDR